MFDRGDAVANGQVSREARAAVESIVTYGGHRIRNGQATGETCAVIEGFAAYSSHGIRNNQAAGEGSLAEHVVRYALHVLSDFQGAAAVIERIVTTRVATVGCVVVHRSDARAVVEGVFANRGDVFANGDFARESRTVLEGPVVYRSREDDGGAAGESGAVVKGAVADMGQFVRQRQGAGEA